MSRETGSVTRPCGCVDHISWTKTKGSARVDRVDRCVTCEVCSVCDQPIIGEPHYDGPPITPGVVVERNAVCADCCTCEVAP